MIEKVKSKPKFLVGDAEYETLELAQRAVLIAWFMPVSGRDAEMAESLADEIIDHADSFRDVVKPFIVKKRGPRKPKAVIEVDGAEGDETDEAASSKWDEAKWDKSKWA